MTTHPVTRRGNGPRPRKSEPVKGEIRHSAKQGLPARKLMWIEKWLTLKRGRVQPGRIYGQTVSPPLWAATMRGTPPCERWRVHLAKRNFVPLCSPASSPPHRTTSCEVGKHIVCIYASWRIHKHCLAGAALPPLQPHRRLRAERAASTC